MHSAHECNRFVAWKLLIMLYDRELTPAFQKKPFRFRQRETVAVQHRSFTKNNWKTLVFEGNGPAPSLWTVITTTPLGEAEKQEDFRQKSWVKGWRDPNILTKYMENLGFSWKRPRAIPTVTNYDHTSRGSRKTGRFPTKVVG